MNNVSDTDTNDDFIFFLGDDDGSYESIEPVYEWTELNGTHRCCAEAKGQSRAAVVVVSKDTGRELLFCGHCFKKHSAGLADKGFTVVYDQRDQLVAKSNEVHA